MTPVYAPADSTVTPVYAPADSTVTPVYAPADSLTPVHARAIARR